MNRVVFAKIPVEKLAKGIIKNKKGSPAYDISAAVEEITRDGSWRVTGVTMAPYTAPLVDINRSRDVSGTSKQTEPRKLQDDGVFVAIVLEGPEPKDE